MRTGLLLLIVAGSLECLAAAMPARADSTMAKELTVEYRRNATGAMTAFVNNRHGAAATAYLVQASYRDGGRERHTAFGGDTLGFSAGFEQELPAKRESDTGRGLPRGAEPSASYVAAVIYADGFTEGDDEIVQMLLAGRHRAYADLMEVIPALERGESKEQVMTLLESIQARDTAEAAKLDDLLDIPGMRNRFFMTAMPTRGIQMLQSSDIAGMLAQCKSWKEKLEASKPGIK